MAEKVTVMVLKVDLHCSTCYKKIKRLLCQFPQIREQIYDEKQNQVIITVACCNPEKIRDKLCCKGGKVIKCIDIRKPPKETPVETPKPDPTPDPTPHPPGPIHVEVQYRYPPPFPTWGCCEPCSEGYPGGPCYHGYGRPAKPPSPYYAGMGIGYGGNKGCYVSRSCDYYFSEENPGCTIM